MLNTGSQLSSGPSAPSNSSALISVQDEWRNDQKLKRRIPKAQRQRIEISCDRCKQRKIRCIRFSTDEVCAACGQAGLRCSSTAPRKQRNYLSVDQLSIRYRLLDSIARTQYPGREVESIEGLRALAKELGAEVPLEEGSIQPLDVTNRKWPTTGTLPHDLRSMTSSHVAPMSGIFNIPEGSLVPAPKGGYHYVGPASLAVFASVSRKLVAKCNFAQLPTFDATGLKRFLKAAEFTTFRTSQAIEARIEGHPATNAAEEENDATIVPADPLARPLGFGTSPAESSPRSTMKQRRMLDVIPDRLLSDRLVTAFFTRVHPNYTIFHRGTFQMRYETIWSSRSENEPGWVCTLYMIYVLGAQAMENELGLLADTLQQRYLSLVIKDGLHRVALTASLANVQALMLLSLYQHNAGERNAAWMLLGQAVRTAVAIGMHRDGQTANFDPFERNVRRTVWWVLHAFEQNLSFALGRPSNTDLLDTSVILPEEIYLDGSDLPPEFLGRSVALTELCARAKRFTASVASFYDDAAHMASTFQMAQHVSSQLIAWRDDLPVHYSLNYHFATSRHRRAVTLLHILCNHLLSIVGRSYLLCRVNIELDSRARGEIPVVPEAIVTMASQSVTAAKRVTDSLLELSRHDLLEGVIWLDFYYVHHAAFILGLHFLGRPSDLSTLDGQNQKDAISTLLGIARQTKLAPTYKILLNVVLQLAYVVGIGPEDEDEPSTTYIYQESTLGSTIIPAVSDPPVIDFQAPFDNPVHPPNLNPDSHTYHALEQLFGPMPPSQHNSPPDLFADLYNFGLDTTADNPWDFFNIGSTADELFRADEHRDRDQVN